MAHTDRDPELGERLRRLDVPEHRPGFFEELHERLEREPGGAGAARRPRERRRWLRLVWIPIPVAAVILVILWALAGPLGIDVFRTETASAAQITAKVVKALANVRALRGTLTVVASSAGAGRYVGPIEAGTEEKAFSFVLTAEGDYRLTASNPAADGLDTSYDHSTGIRKLLVRLGPGEPMSASQSSGLSLGPPDSYQSSWYEDLAAAVRALRESTAASVPTTSYEGHPAWVLDTDLSPNLITNSGFDHVQVTILKEAAFPVRVVYSENGRPALSWSLSKIEVDPQLPEGAFTFAFPAGVQVERTDHGFKAVSVAGLAAEAKAVVGYVPVLPSWLPEGFALGDARVAKMGQPSGKEGMNPPAPGVVSAVYQRGLDRVIVTTRIVGDDPSLWSDPMSSGEGYIDSPEKVALRAGRFGGAEAELVLNIRTPPHVWAMNDKLVMTISGDLTRDELVRVAESMTPVE